MRLLREPRIRDYLDRARPFRKQAITIVVVGTLLAVVAALLWPPTYIASTTLLPPSEEDTGFSMTSLMRGLAVPGIRIPTRSGPEDIAVSVLGSRRIMGTLVERFNLTEEYNVGSPADALQRIAKNSSFGVDHTGTLTISVRDSDPQRAAYLANAFAEELDRFNRDIRMTKGRRMRLFIEERLGETGESMVKAEESLQEYQELHSAVVLGPEQSSTIEAGARLFARQAALRVRLGLVRQYAAESSEEVRMIRQELDEVNRQIGALPDVGLELARQIRELRIQEEVYALLMAQYEEARINEARDIATLEVLDVAVPPSKRAWPRRGLLTILGFAFSVLAAATWVGFQIRPQTVAEEDPSQKVARFPSGA